MDSRLPLAVAAFALATSAPLAAHGGAKYEPPDGKILHGAGQDDPAFAAYAGALATHVGDDSLHPYVIKRYYALYDRKTEDWYESVVAGDPQAVIDAYYAVIVQDKLDPLATWLAAQATAGTMPEISVSFTPRGSVTPDLLIPGGTFDQEIDDLADVLAAFDGPLFVRIGFEPAQSAMGYTPGAPYIDSYRHIVDHFRAHGVDAAYILCSGPGTGDTLDDLDANGNPIWYPGHEYVDWLGHDPLGPDTVDPLHTKYAQTLALLDFAAHVRKPVFLSESSASFLSLGGTGTTLADAQAAWSEYFGPFFTLVKSDPWIKGFAYIDWDWDAHNFTGWGDARIENNPYLVAMIAAELADSAYIHRDTTVKFEEPWWDEARFEATAGGSATLTGSNAQSSGGCTTNGIAWIYVATAPYVANSPTCCTGTTLLDYELGFSAYSGYWFLASTSASPVSATCLSGGAFSLPMHLPSNLAGLSLYLQGIFAPSMSGPVSLTGLVRLDCL